MSTIRPRNMFHDPRDEIPLFEYNTLDELIQIPFVKRRQENPLFLKFSMNRELSSRVTLMVEYIDGAFWVIGYCSDDVPELPEWDFDTCQERKRLHNETSN